MRENYLHLLRLITGVIIFFLLAIHMIMMRLDDILGFFGIHIEEPTSWSSVMERAGSLGWMSFYLVLLALALYHGLYGLRAILIELPLPSFIARSIGYILLAIGVMVFAYGAYIPISAY